MAGTTDKEEKRKLTRVKEQCPECYGRGWVLTEVGDVVCRKCWGEKTLVRFVWVKVEDKGDS